MGYFSYAPAGGGGGGVATKVVLYEDLSPQIDGIKKTFTVKKGNYVAGQLNVMLASNDQVKDTPDVVPPENFSYAETDPATGTFTFVDAPQPADMPLLVTYEWV